MTRLAMISGSLLMRMLTSFEDRFTIGDAASESTLNSAKLERVERPLGSLEMKFKYVDASISSFEARQGDLQSKLNSVSTQAQQIETAVASVASGSTTTLAALDNCSKELQLEIRSISDSLDTFSAQQKQLRESDQQS